MLSHGMNRMCFTLRHRRRETPVHRITSFLTVHDTNARRPHDAAVCDDASLCPSRLTRLARAHHVMLARAHDLPLIPAIELAASRLLTGLAPASVLDETTTQFALRKARRAGRLWV